MCSFSFQMLLQTTVLFMLCMCIIWCSEQYKNPSDPPRFYLKPSSIQMVVLLGKTPRKPLRVYIRHNAKPNYIKYNFGFRFWAVDCCDAPSLPYISAGEIYFTRKSKTPPRPRSFHSQSPQCQQQQQQHRPRRRQRNVIRNFIYNGILCLL